MKRFLIGAAEIELKANKAKSRNYDDKYFYEYGFTQTSYGMGMGGILCKHLPCETAYSGQCIFLHPLISKVCTFPRSLCELRVCASQCVKCAVQALDLLDALP